MNYLALLRGINVGGHNRVPMNELQVCFELLGFRQVRTYINSGNVLFDATTSDVTTLIQRCEAAIAQRFGFHVVCTVMSSTDLQDAMAHAPAWWGLQDEYKHHAIFVIPPATCDKILQEVGEAKPENEKIASYGQVLFWTAPNNRFEPTRYSNIVRASAYKFVTIRNSATCKALVALSIKSNPCN
jgi:uncharacterized protein (DUF1697 family)